MAGKILFGLPEAEYHSDKRMSKHSLDEFAHNPYAYFKRREEGAPKVEEAENPAFATGSAVHAAVLEPERFKDDFVVQPETIKVRRGKEWDAFKVGAVGKTIIKQADFETATAIAQTLHGHAMAEKLFAGVTTEVSVFWEHENFSDIGLRSRIDFLSAKGAIVGDLKTTNDASPEAFMKDCDAYGYDIQAAFYIDAIRACGMDPKVFAFVVVEKTYPFTPAIYTFDVDSDFICAGRMEYEKRLQMYKDFTEKGAEIPVGWDAHNLSLPAWSKRLKALREAEAAAVANL